VVLGTEIALAISWLGQRFERFDLSAKLKRGARSKAPRSIFT
jgi:hypothetical protein